MRLANFCFPKSGITGTPGRRRRSDSYRKRTWESHPLDHMDIICMAIDLKPVCNSRQKPMSWPSDAFSWMRKARWFSDPVDILNMLVRVAEALLPLPFHARRHTMADWVISARGLWRTLFVLQRTAGVSQYDHNIYSLVYKNPLQTRVWRGGRFSIIAFIVFSKPRSRIRSASSRTRSYCCVRWT